MYKITVTFDMFPERASCKIKCRLTYLLADFIRSKRARVFVLSVCLHENLQLKLQPRATKGDALFTIICSSYWQIWWLARTLNMEVTILKNTMHQISVHSTF